MWDSKSNDWLVLLEVSGVFLLFCQPIKSLKGTIKFRISLRPETLTDKSQLAKGTRMNASLSVLPFIPPWLYSYLKVLKKENYLKF